MRLTGRRVIPPRLKTVNDHNAEALMSGGIVTACGMARYENDECVATVFERADHNMYENKNSLKSAEIKRGNGNGQSITK